MGFTELIRKDACLFLPSQSGWETAYRCAEHFEAPFYLFDWDKIRDCIAYLRQRLGGVQISYAMKANPWLVLPASSAADYVEVSTPGELATCRERGIPGERLTLDGCYLPEDTVRLAMDMGVTRFCADSTQQWERLRRLSDGRPLCVLPRIASDGQFGMEWEDLQSCLADPGSLRAGGVQYYPGTQRMDARQVRRELHILQGWLERLESGGVFRPETVEFGAGIGYPYFEEDRMEDCVESLNAVAEGIDSLKSRYRIVYEAGRILAASGGIYVTEVFSEKCLHGRRYLFCLGGTGHLQYPGGALGIRTPRMRGIPANPAGVPGIAALCGPFCARSDILSGNCESLDCNLTVGDRILFYGAGAYSATLSPQFFLCGDLPRILICRRQTDNSERVDCIRDSIATWPLLEKGMK